MSHVITQACCNDASCVPVCPVGCIHPTPDEPGFATAEMLYIDPASCIDCGACVSECPVGAISRDTGLGESGQTYLGLATAYYQGNPLPPGLPVAELAGRRSARLNVAVVGSGAAGSYAAAELLAAEGVTVTVFDQLPTPWGLVRGGVAPDHQHTKDVTKVFERAADDGRFRFYLNVEVGKHISHDELVRHYDTVIYAYGAAQDKQLSIAGADMPHSVSATEFVNWYNGHPDYADRAFDLSGKRAVIIGNGNVALDIARLLAIGPEQLATTDIADHALDALAASAIEEIVVLGRRGPAQAAYTTPELIGLCDVPGVDIITLPDEVAIDTISREELDNAPATRIKTDLAANCARGQLTPGNKRIILRYFASPAEITAQGIRVARTRLERGPDGGIRAVPTGAEETLETGLIIRSVGYRGTPIQGLPFDTVRSVVHHEDGRVLDPATGIPIRGVYVTGWIKRGPTGGIGTNRKCARDTVRHLLDDHADGKLQSRSLDHDIVDTLIRERQPNVVDLTGWRRIHDLETEQGRSAGKPRRKLTSRADLLHAALGR